MTMLAVDLDGWGFITAMMIVLIVAVGLLRHPKPEDEADRAMREHGELPREEAR